MATDAEGMRGIRSRDLNGELRAKRSDTLMGNIEKKYDLDFGVRSDMQLGTYLKKLGPDSQDDILKGARRG